MEAARLDPQGGTGSPGTLEDGGSDAAGVTKSPTNGCKSTCHAGSTEGPRASPYEGTRHNGEARTSDTEGPQSSDKGPCSPRADRTEGPQNPANTGTPKGPQVSGSSSAEDPCSPRSGSAYGPQGPAAGTYGGPCSPRSGSTYGPQGPAAGTYGGPCSPRVGNTDGPQSPDSSGTEGPGNGESSSHTGCGSNEVPRNRAVEGPGASRDITKQRITEEPHNASTSTEGPNAFGANSATESHHAWPRSTKEHASDEHADHGQGDGPSEDPGNAEPFKKPVTPVWPDSNEKTVEPRNKSASPSQPPGGPDREAAQNVGPRLPSDAYKPSPAIPYREPAWSGRPQALYSLEVLKGGAILSTKSLSDDSWYVFGRLPVCHVSLEHPSVSRFHAVLQYRSVSGSDPDQETGFYVFDLGSTHGTFINKQKIPPKTYCRFRVGHVLKFGGSTRLFVLQGPDEDQEEESELTVTEIKEARRQRENLQKRMLGDDSDEDDHSPEEEERKERARPSDESGCMWGMGEDAMEEENDENPIALQFQEEREALYLKDPKKTLQGFFDREGEELEFEYDERGPGSWICRIKLPVDDSSGKQLVAEINHTGKKKDAARLCSLEACRMLDMRGLLRQEAVSRKRKAKKWEDEDFYDSDDDTFLDRTGIVEKKRLTRMKKAGKIEDKPETLQSLTTKLELLEKEMEEIAAKLKTSHTGGTQPSAQDSLDAFMTEIRASSSMDSVSRKKLHLQSQELKKEQQRLKALIKIVQPAKLPELRTDLSAQDPKAKKLTLPMFGAMKGGSKFKLKTGTVGRLPPKRTDLPASLFTMKDDGNEVEEEEDEDDGDMKVDNASDQQSEDGNKPEAAEQCSKLGCEPKSPEMRGASGSEEVQSPEKHPGDSEPTVKVQPSNDQKPSASQPEARIPKPSPEKPKRMHGPSRPPQGVLSTKYPEDDPDYCVWTPPAGQTGDGKTHLNDKYGY